MPRPLNPDLTKKWKICLPATLAGTVELYLFDRLHNKPKYGSRGKLITDLLEKWVAEQQSLAKQENPGA
jgi:metal-responsive CopG/Arc/MetJ family transcriptional regulator